MQCIVLDFEATCDEHDRPNPQEIIEFPAIRVDADSPADLEFHTFVRPIAHPVLTPFCTRLTGICQEQVDAAPTFPEALALFTQWKLAHCHPDAPIVICGDWDLGTILPRQCVQHRLPVPAWAANWINIKRLFAEVVPKASAKTGMMEMARVLGVPMLGRHHSGIDDTRNIVRILRKLFERGAILTMPTLPTER